jgi:hypothetical protein
MKKRCETEIPLRLTWDERNPRSYLYNSSREMKWLRREVSLGKETFKVSGVNAGKNIDVNRVKVGNTRRPSSKRH